MGKRLIALLSVLLLLLMATACAEINSVPQLNAPEMTVGIDQGSAAELTVRQELPRAKLAYFNDKPSAYLAVAQGKVDAFVFDYNQMRLAIENGVEGIRILDEALGEPVRIAVGVSPVSGIPELQEKLNLFIAGLREGGTLDDMLRRWVSEGVEEIPDIPRPENPSLRLTVGTSGIVPPYSYYKGTELTGFDIELGFRFAAWLGADLRFKVYDYGAIVPAAVTGEVDCVMANLNITPERAEALPFSDVLYEEKLGVMVAGNAQPDRGRDAAHTSLDQLNGRRVGTGMGTLFDDLVRRRLPDVTIRYYSAFGDVVAALESGEIDAFVCAEPALRSIIAQDSRVKMLPDPLGAFESGFVFSKDEGGAERCARMSEFIREMRDSGELSRLEEKWLCGDAGEARLPETDALGGESGALTLAIETLDAPSAFALDGGYAGYEIELAARFCERYDYRLTVRYMDFDDVLMAVRTGEADFGGTTTSIAGERREGLEFSEPHYLGDVELAVLGSKDTAVARNGSGDFWAGMRSSFEKTFLREARWRLFLQGVATTLVITALTVFFGTALGFTVFMLCRNGNPLAKRATRFCLWLVQGMPMVVLLMILYYVVFGSVAVNGVVVAVIGFTLTFGAAVYGLVRMGVGAVDNGQYEAAYALGYSRRRTFYRIILPQALPHVLPAYRGEIVGLIKATAVVGYIAVQDLTKMGDIIRSRTYEAFFPLIAVTVIYFALEGLIGFLVGRISLSFNPKRRKTAAILKGVKTDDQD